MHLTIANKLYSSWSLRPWLVMTALGIPFEETVRRHATRPKATEFTGADMADWYHPLDLLDEPRETVIDQHSSLATTVARILTETGLARIARPSQSRSTRPAERELSDGPSC